MKVIAIYKDASDHGREMREYLADFSRRTGRSIDYIDPDVRTGVDFCRTYDIVEYPTMVALDEEGRLLNIWRGRPLPTFDEVSYYVS